MYPRVQWGFHGNCGYWQSNHLQYMNIVHCGGFFVTPTHHDTSNCDMQFPFADSRLTNLFSYMPQSVWCDLTLWPLVHLSYLRVCYRNVLLAHARSTMFYIRLVSVEVTESDTLKVAHRRRWRQGPLSLSHFCWCHQSGNVCNQLELSRKLSLLEDLP